LRRWWFTYRNYIDGTRRHHQHPNIMDEVDQANDHIEREMQARLSARRLAELQPCGSCYNCGEDIAPGRKFCDIECREDYDHRITREKKPA
jgi:RNA polymerase-binding transcription factor DksA